MSLPTPALDYHIESFAHGFMDSPEAQRLPTGATPDAKNCLFSSLQQGNAGQSCNIQKRTGARLLTTASVVAGNGFDGLVEFRKLGQASGRIVGVIGGKAWYWDNVSSFVQIGATAPFAVGTKVAFYVQRNLLFIMDGVNWRGWDGVIGHDLFIPGQIAPTGAPTLAAVAGPGITGTFEGYAVWYDSVLDHETSPSALSAQVALANQQRQWTKPAGAPAANYDNWRIYCRRVDTFEVYYKLVATTVVGTATVTEQLTDAARNLATFGPLPGTNDVPPTTYTSAVEFQGYRVSVPKNDDQLHASRVGDPQSQKASDLIGVSRGIGGEVRSLFKFGKECVVQKAQRSYVLKGDRMPFIPDEVHSTLGNVGPTSAVEVKGRFFAWDEETGPYWTDLSTWQPIATGVVSDLIVAIPKNYLPLIDAVYLKRLDIVIWSIPAGNGRRRTLLPYHVGVNAWLPPVTGLEYGTLCTFVDTNGSTNLYVGDHWGRLFQYFVDDVEGVPSGTLVARVSAATSGTVTCDNVVTIDNSGAYTVGGAVAFYTTGDGLKGLPVLHLTADGSAQWRRIQSNSGSVLTLDTTNDSPWGTVPMAWAPGASSGDIIIVGGIDWYWRSPLITFGDPFRAKKAQLFAVQARPGSANFRLRLTGLLEGLANVSFRKYLPFAATSVWGAGLWGVMIWGGSDARPVKTRVQRSFFAFAFEFANPFPNQPVEVVSARLTADPLPRRWVGSSG